MPNIVMHHHFGKVVYSALSEEVKKSIGFIDLYDFATTGPDSFEKIHFLNNKNNNDHKLFSEQMHTKKSKDFFMKMIEMARVDYHMFSYLCGFVTHYFLDVYTNPFIFHLSGLYDPTDESTIEYRGMSEKLKLAYDCYVIENYYDCKPHAFRINRKILKLRKIKKTFKGSLDRLYSSIYGKTEGYKYVNSAIRWQKIYYALTFDRFGLLNKILSKKDDGKSQNDLNQVSYYNKKIDTSQIDIFNFKHNVWSNPVDKEMQSTESFFDLFDKAKKITVECINDLYKYVKEAESFDFDYYFKDLSYYNGFPCSYNLEMKNFNNILKKDLF